MDRQNSSVNYVRLARRIIAHRWRIVLAGLLAVAVPTIVWTIVASHDTYEASATLFLLPEKTDHGVLRDFMNPEINSLYQVVLRSRSLAQAVVETLPKESRDELNRQIGIRDYFLVVMNHVRRWRGQEVIVFSPTEIAVRELQEARMAFAIAKDGTVTVTGTAYSPRVAVDLTNTYVEVLLSRSSSFARQQARGTRELIESMLAQAKTNQAEAEDALRKFQAQGGGAVKLPDESRMELQRLGKLETDLSDVQVNTEIAQNRLAYLRGERKAAGQGQAVDPAAQSLRDRLSLLETKSAGLLEKYTAQHPLVQTIQAEMQDIQERLKTSLQSQQTPKPGGVTTLKPVETAQLSRQMADLEVGIISSQAKEQGLLQRIGRLKKSMATMGLREHEYSGLARTAETQSKVAGMLSEKLAAARMSEQTQIRGIQVIDLASLPKQPSAKQPMRIVLLGLFGGLGLGLGAAALREYATQVIETENEVTSATGLLVLGSIPLALSRPGALAAVDAPTIFVAAQDPHSLPADSCRAIRVAIDCQSLDRPLKTLLVTSPGPHEGKSTMVANLALAFAESGRRVLVIDADLRRPSMHRAWRLQNEGGLADILQKGAAWPEAFQQVAPGLELLPAGIKPHNPGSLVGSRNMTKLLEQARERADIVLIDSPPVLAVADCLPLTRHVDGVLLVTRFGKTQRRSALRAKEMLEKVGAHLVGVVVNGLSPRETRRHYGEYEDYVGAGKAAGRKKKRKSMKSLFTSLLVGLTILGSAVASSAAEDEYKIGTDDVLHVIVWDNKDLEQTVIVRPDGKISFPLAGEIQAQNLTVPQLTEILTQRLSTAVKNPNVSVMVKEIRSFRVHFVGRIAKPGVYPIKAGTPLLQALTLAGGTSENADLPGAYIIRGEKTIPIDLRKLIQEGDLSKNIRMEREDTIVVPEIALGSNPQEILDRRIYVLGKVAKPGVYTLKQDVPILHALFLAGGVADTGDLASAFVIRGKDKIPVDLWKLIQKGDLSQNIMIKHEDTVVIPAGGELQNAVYVMGEVNKPGVYSQPEALSLLRLVTLAGGFTKYAAPGRATLIRRDGDKKILMKVDLKDIMNDPKANEDLSLRPGDVLIVPERLF